MLTYHFEDTTDPYRERDQYSLSELPLLFTLEHILSLFRVFTHDVVRFREIVEEMLLIETDTNLVVVDPEKTSNLFSYQVGLSLDAWLLINPAVPGLGSYDTRLFCVLADARAMKTYYDKERQKGGSLRYPLEAKYYFEFRSGLMTPLDQGQSGKLPQLCFSLEEVSNHMLKIDVVESEYTTHR